MKNLNEMKNVNEMKNGAEMKNGVRADAVCYMKPNWSFVYLVTIIFFSIVY